MAQSRTSHKFGFLFRAGLLSATIPLDMTLYLLKEREVSPWKTALTHLRNWKRILQDTDLVPLLDSLVQHLISPLYNDLGWVDKGSHEDRLLRNLILCAAVDFGMEDATKTALQFFKGLVTSGTKISPNFRSLVYKTGIRHGRTIDWKYAWRMYTNTTVASERNLWMNALAASSNTYSLQQYLQAAINTNKIRSQDVKNIFNAVSSNPSGSQIAWRELQVSWDLLVKKFGEGSMSLGMIIQSSIAHFSTDYDYDAVTRFFREKRADVGSGIRDLDQGIEQIIINIQWRTENEAIVRDWISNKLAQGADKELLNKNTLMN